MFQCVDILEKWQSSSTATGVGGAETIAAVEELTSILTSYDMEALLLAHDSIVSYVEGLQRKQSPSSSPPSGPPSPTSSWKDSRVVDNIKIIRIEKTNEPLGATVRNEGDAVIIGNHIFIAYLLCDLITFNFENTTRNIKIDLPHKDVSFAVVRRISQDSCTRATRFSR